MQVEIHGVSKSFGSVQVLRGIDLTVPAGGVTAVLGPSGCGKTTLLRLIAGFDAPDAGTIQIGDTRVFDERRRVPPERRHIGYVAQEGALFPHLTVSANVAFGLKAGRLAEGRVAGLLELVGLDPAYCGRYPHELSGGQQQRVALARALAVEPAVVLLDEPFSSLDAGLREGTRRAVLQALAATRATALLVTHDQAEALSTACQVAVMRAGALVQVGPPAAVYAAPADLGVATFLGDAVVVPGEVAGGVVTCPLGRRPVARGVPDGPGQVMVRPEQLALAAAGGSSGVPARVREILYFGPYAQVHLTLAASGIAVTARVPGYQAPRVGADVCLTLEGPCHVFPYSEPVDPSPAAVSLDSGRQHSIIGLRAV